MARLDEEQRAALRKFKEETLGGTPAEAKLPRPTTPARTFADRGYLPVPEVAQIVGCEDADVLMILCQLGYTKKSAISRLTVGEAEPVRDKWNLSKSAATRPTWPLGLLAAELEADLHLLALEARRAGIPVRGDRGAFTLFEVEADHLRRLVASWPEKFVRSTGPAVGSIRTSAIASKQSSTRISIMASRRQTRASTASDVAGKAIPAAAVTLASNTQILPRRRPRPCLLPGLSHHRNQPPSSVFSALRLRARRL